jgi:hypothetical protein
VIPFLLLAAATLAVGLDAPWWLRGLLIPPAVMWAPGWNLARRLDPDETSGLQRILDATWIGLALTWVGVALMRELGADDAVFGWGLLAWASAWTGLGAVLARGRTRAVDWLTGERWGVAAVVVAVLAVGVWRAEDVARPLDAYWWHPSASEAGSSDGAPLDLLPARGWAEPERIGWEDAGAWRITPTGSTGEFVSPGGARGTVVLAARGPIGTTLTVGGRTARVQASPVEEPDEGPVRRYLRAGTVGLAVPIDLEPGGAIQVQTTATEVYLLSSADAVWALHAEGGLRYVHYYQLLNQVENLDWAKEVRADRWFTWNQPPGWSPILAVATLLVAPDLPGCNALFLWVVVLVGLSAVRLAALVGPGAPTVAWLIPGGLAAAHGLLMLEPASTNFPDSLYAASILGVAGALAAGRERAFAGMGLWSQALRWPGAIVASILALAFITLGRARPWRGLGLLWGGVIAGGLIAALAAATGHAEDLLFILYFETFPEHWHGEADPLALLTRVPGFYGTWMVYTGGALIAAVGLSLGRNNPPRSGARALIAAALVYSTFLATIDHDPTHYYLPLVALTGPAVVAGCAAARPRLVRLSVPIAILVGILIFLWKGQV